MGRAAGEVEIGQPVLVAVEHGHAAAGEVLPRAVVDVVHAPATTASAAVDPRTIPFSATIRSGGSFPPEARQPSAAAPTWNRCMFTASAVLASPQPSAR